MAGSVNKVILVGNTSNVSGKICSFCGKFYSRNRKYSSAQWSRSRACSRKCSSSHYKVSDSDVLNLFAAGKLICEIAENLGVSARSVRAALARNGVTRSPHEMQKISHSRPQVRLNHSKANKGRPCPEHLKIKLRAIFGPDHHLWKGGITHGGKYSHFTGSRANGDVASKSIHSVLAEKYLGYVRGIGLHVHHIDGDTKNNDLSNLAVMTASDHARLHAIQSGLGHK